MPILMGMLMSLGLVAVSSGTANADGSWTAAEIGSWQPVLATAPSGNVTVACSGPNGPGSGQDLTTYTPSGTVVSQISRTSQIDGVTNCIPYPIVDKNGSVYGQPYDLTSGNRGPNLLAYNGSTLKWKYPVSCTDSSYPSAVGADGNIYAVTRNSDGTYHLIGLTPNVAAGQTTPTKVLDVVVPSDSCRATLHPYKDGIVLGGDVNTMNWYSYGGKLFRQVSGNGYYDTVNANGRLFRYTWQSLGNNRRSLSVSSFDPSKDQPTWTTQVSSVGADAPFAQYPTPLPGGGAVALFQQSKMVSDGIPAVPEERVWALVTLSASGQKVRTVILPSLNAQGDQWSSPMVTSDGANHIVVARELEKSTGISYPSTVPQIVISVLDASSGAEVSNATIAGTINAQTQYGYALDGWYSMGLSFSSGKLYITGHCVGGGCPTYLAMRMFSVDMPGLGMDYPRGDVLNTGPRPTSSYIALGDSFSSGEGVSPFEASTNLPDVNTCHRSTVAYARLIAGTSAKIPSLGTGGFRACSGAVTTNITDVPQWNESPQLGWFPDTTTQLVTMTIGGNDIKFSAFGKACVTQACDVGTTAYTDSLNEINNNLSAKLTATYRSILKYMPNAKIYILGYPQVVANKSVTAANDSRCFYMQDGSTKWGDARAARDIVTKLNTKISAAVTTVRGESSGNVRLKYVALDATGSPFIGHEVCGTSSTSWFQNVDQALNGLEYVFHPNNLGQQGYATVAGAAINAG